MIPGRWMVYRPCLSLQDPVQGGNKPLVFLGFTYSHPDIGWISENVAGADDDAFLKQRLEHLPAVTSYINKYKVGLRRYILQPQAGELTIQEIPPLKVQFPAF